MQKVMWALVGAIGVVVVGLVVISLVSVHRWWAAPAGPQVLPSPAAMSSPPPPLTQAPAVVPTADPVATTSPAPPTAGALTGTQIARQAAQRMNAVQTFHFLLAAGGAAYRVDAYMDSPVPVTLRGIEGNVAKPDRMSSQINVKSLGLDMAVTVVKVGANTYMNNPLVGGWQQLPAEESQALDLAVLFDTQTGLPAVLTRYESTIAGVDSFNGQPAYHLVVANTSDVLIPATQGATAVEVWVDQTSMLIQRMVLTGLEPNSGQLAVWTVDMSAFDQPVNIVAPM